jgi:Ran-binding protein 9/10
MTNPYQHGTSGLPDPNMSAGSSGLLPRRFSYASIPPGGSSATNFFSHPSRTSVVSHLLNPSSDPADVTSGHHASGRQYDMDAERNGVGQNGAGSRPWARSTQLPSFSRAFEMFMGQSTIEPNYSASQNGFFIPSYLSGSTYVQKLEDAYKAKVQSQRDFHLSQNQTGTLNTSPSSVNLHNKTPTSHRGMTYDVIEKLPSFDDDESIPPLPSKWNKDDKWGGLDVLPDGQEVRYTSVRGHSDRDHEACSIRADHYMPSQCGMYYYEVTILSGKRDEYVVASSVPMIRVKYDLLM